MLSDYILIQAEKGKPEVEVALNILYFALNLMDIRMPVIDGLEAIM